MSADDSLIVTKIKTLFATMQRGHRWMGIDVPKTIELKVHIAQDEESGCWYIAASDIPGLRVEADTVHDLIRRIEDVAPDLIELNCAEILASFGKSKKLAAHRPPVSILPVFDSPLAVAIA